MSFKNKRKVQAEKNFKSYKLKNAAKTWHDVSRSFKYQYMFDWLVLPIIQDPSSKITIHTQRFRNSLK